MFHCYLISLEAVMTPVFWFIWNGVDGVMILYLTSSLSPTSRSIAVTYNSNTNSLSYPATNWHQLLHPLITHQLLINVVKKIIWLISYIWIGLNIPLFIFHLSISAMAFDKVILESCTKQRKKLKSHCVQKWACLYILF